MHLITKQMTIDKLLQRHKLQYPATWMQNICNECNQDADVVVQLGEEPEYDSATANICFNCLEKALKLKEQYGNKNLHAF